MKYKVTVVNKHGLQKTSVVDVESEAEAYRYGWRTFAAEDIFVECCG